MYYLNRMLDYEQDNIIEWIFEKIFNNIVSIKNEKKSDLYVKKFEFVYNNTFNNTQIHDLIYKLTNKPNIVGYLTNKLFCEKFILSKTKNKIYFHILSNNFNDFITQIDYIDDMCYQLIVVNDRFDMLDYIFKLNNSIVLNNNLLYYSCDSECDKMYFYLRSKNLLPNISIYYKAVCGTSVKIVSDISTYIGLSNSVLVDAFQANNSEIILLLLDIASNEKVNINKELISYPILNNNMIVLNELDRRNLITWNYTLYYSAILSGSLEMIKFVESKMPDLHKTRILDSSKTKKGQANLLLKDTIYELNGKKFFSHTINYAVQSRSLAVLQYVHNLNYGITVSNFITAIKQSTIEILQYLCDNYIYKLPFYVLHYLSIYSYIPHKIEKTKILMMSNLLTMNKKNINVDDYRIETLHLQLINDNNVIYHDFDYDTDWLLNLSIFFVPMKGFKLNYFMLTKIKVLLCINDYDEIVNMYATISNINDKQHFIDTIFLFGSIDQIKKIFMLINLDMMPSTCIIMEIMCYGQINKLCFLIHKNIFDKSVVSAIFPVIIMLADPFLIRLISKYEYIKPNLKFLLRSKKVNYILEYIDKYPEIVLEPIDKTLIEQIFCLENSDLLKKIVDYNTFTEYYDWAIMSGFDYVKLINYKN